MQVVGLFDEINIDWTENENSEGLSIELTTNKFFLPTDSKNLAYRAALLMNEAAEKKGFLKIEINKKIPVAAGLGGGSGNAAAVIVGLNRIWKLGLTTKKLCEIGSRIGADVAFMVLTENTKYTAARGIGVGEVLTPLKNGVDAKFVLAKPTFGVSTAEVFKGIDEIVLTSRPDTEKLIRALEIKNQEQAFECMDNVLEQYTLVNYPIVKELKEILSQTDGVRKVMMSGSGPTVYGIYDSLAEAKAACFKMRACGFEAFWADSVRRNK